MLLVGASRLMRLIDQSMSTPYVLCVPIAIILQLIVLVVVSGVTITFAKVASGPTGSAELRWSMPGAAFVNVSTHPGVDVETAICSFLFHAFVLGRTNPPSLSVTARGSFQPAVPSPSRSTKTSHPAR